MPRKLSAKRDTSTGKVHFDRGVALFSLGKYEEATKEYEMAIRFDPKNAAAYNNNGNVLENLGKYVDAVMEFDAAISIDPNNRLYVKNKDRVLKLLAFEDKRLVHKNSRENKKGLVNKFRGLLATLKVNKG